MDITFPIEWREDQQQSLYPFADGSSLITKTGQALPAEIFADAAIYPIGGEPPIYLSKVSIAVRKVTLYIGGTGNDSLAFGSYDPVDPSEAIELTDISGRSCGALVLNKVEAAVLQSWPVGDHTFNPANSTFCPTVILALPNYGVTSVILNDGTVLTGDVWLVGGNGVILREYDGSIRADIVGDPLSKRNRCDADVVNSFVTPKFLKTINGIEAGVDNDFKILVGQNQSIDNIIRVYPQDGSLRVEVVGQVLSGVV